MSVRTAIAVLAGFVPFYFLDDYICGRGFCHRCAGFVGLATDHDIFDAILLSVQGGNMGYRSIHRPEAFLFISTHPMGRSYGNQSQTRQCAKGVSSTVEAHHL